uniref:ATP synthase F(0) complex subunit e, mitochondrial n=1 Tax=Hippocampus comes TaxID=109280 RepID=A0A3Q2XTG6_HIPCM
MAPPVAVSPLIKTARWSALLLGVLYGKQRFGKFIKHSSSLIYPLFVPHWG